jgi:S1-C subfamily serine protease
MGPLAGTYNLDILFVNDSQDVAIARAKGVRSDKWASLRLKEGSVKGEKIVAIGNPGLPTQVMSHGSVSLGIISNPFVVMRTGQERTVCDITVAQGSSGGPVISLETGEVLGVVTHIIEAGIKPELEVSTSGYLCLAAPSVKLGEWLGLCYSE